MEGSSPVEARHPPAAALLSRQHTLVHPQTPLQRLGLWALTLQEQVVAWASQLPDTPVYDSCDFPWVSGFEAQWPSIRKELDAIMVYRDRMPSFHEILKETATITQDDSWKTWFLINAGQVCEDNAGRCPQTMQLLKSIPRVTTAFFSILAPGKHIPAHRGAYNGVLRFHLGLLVPEPRERCRIRVGDQYRSWAEGKALIFDDSFNHEVWNDTDGYRVVLFVDFPRPLRQPWHWLNERFLSFAPLVPSLREAGMRLREWEKKFKGR